MRDSSCTYLYRADICVLCDVLVLVQRILGQLSLLLLHRKLNQEHHNRLQRGDGNISGALRGYMLME